jgi:hypothetical protein
MMPLLLPLPLNDNALTGRKITTTKTTNLNADQVEKPA